MAWCPIDDIDCEEEKCNLHGKCHNRLAEKPIQSASNAVLSEPSIYSMGLHEQLTPSWNTNLQITRVAGGWIYRFFESSYIEGPSGSFSENYSVDSVFVPYDNQFQRTT